jgi:hypothetical protein
MMYLDFNDDEFLLSYISFDILICLCMESSLFIIICF